MNQTEAQSCLGGRIVALYARVRSPVLSYFSEMRKV